MSTTSPLSALAFTPSLPLPQKGNKPHNLPFHYVCMSEQVPNTDRYLLRTADLAHSSKPLHPVLEVLKSRVQSGSLPGKRKDKHKVALVIEGGGMRGIISAGMCAALKYTVRRINKLDDVAFFKDECSKDCLYLMR